MIFRFMYRACGEQIKVIRLDIGVAQNLVEKCSMKS